MKHIVPYKVFETENRGSDLGRNLGLTEPTELDVVKKLEEWGYDVEGHGDGMVDFIDGDGYNAAISVEDFDFEDKSCLKYSTLYSCCGDELDRDSMICPTCKEHC